MDALRIHDRGGSEGLAYEEAPVPEPGTGDVLVRVHAGPGRSSSGSMRT